MSDPTKDNPPRLGEWVDAVADRFEAAWKAVQPPHLTDFVGDATEEQKAALLAELREIDRLYRLRLTDRPDAHDTVTVGATPPTGAPAFPTVPGYDIEAELGHGGMSVVYRARHRALKRTVALKLLRAGADAGGRLRQRFRAEAEAAARLQHPHIAQVYEVGEHDGQPYLALEYVAGGNLARHLAGKPLPARAAAALVETLARAMHHAHGQGIVHRDLKPANILLANGGRKPPGEESSRGLEAAPGGLRPPFADLLPKIADFGLAKLLDADAGQTRTGEIVGTPSYMAPEQATPLARSASEGPPIAPLIDVYALGAILYELLTGRPPFQGETYLDTLEQVCKDEPVPPRRLQPKVPRDLETICLKALAKQPGRRYASAEALADDLRRFVDGRPIVARPTGRAEKAWRWCRRNPRVAGLAAAVGVLMAGVTVASTLAAVEASQREQERIRETLVQQIHLVRSSTHGNGWSDDAWKLVRQAAAVYRDDKEHRLRNEAAATLAGLDARTVRRWESDTAYKHDAAAVAFAADGKLLVGGANDLHGQPKLPARLWNAPDHPLAESHASQQKGVGPVAFARDGTPLQLVPRDGPPSVLVWDVAGQRRVSAGHFSDLSPDARLMRNDLRIAVTAFSANGAVVAAAAGSGSEGSGVVAVWETATGRRLVQEKADANAIALAPDGSTLAVADRKGLTRFFTLTKNQPPAPIGASRLPIHCLAFSGDGMRLAVGDAGGGLNIWDVTRRLRTPCHGSLYDVYAAAFSPDGTLLASGGRIVTKLWDAATGRLLLDLDSGDYITGLAFAPDGQRLAVSSQTGFGPGRVYVWQLENGRGIRTLHGLSSQVAKVHFSSNGERLAAVGHNWQVAIWEVKTGRLQHLLGVPRGIVGNFSVAFSPDGRRFAFATGTDAKLWDLDTGKELGAWRLPKSKVNCVTFHPDGALLLIREETATGREPLKHNNFKDHQRICPIRELVVPNRFREIAAVHEFNEYVYAAAAGLQGRMFLVEGYHNGADGKRRTVHAFDALTGKKRWSMPSKKWRDDSASPLQVDPSGRLVVISEDHHADPRLVEVTSGQVQEPEPNLSCLGPNAKYVLAVAPTHSWGMDRKYTLFRREDRSALISFSLDASPYGGNMIAEFSTDPSWIAWGNEDGRVFLGDLSVIQKKLADIGLGW